jgi:UDP-sulfoquinovose synthase
VNILLLGGDGYLGWPTGIDLAAQGHQVTLVDNMTRRRLCEELDCRPLFDVDDAGRRVKKWRALTGHSITFLEGDVIDYDFLANLIRTQEPEVIIHFAEQPSAPYSMKGYDEARFTISNNILSTLNVAFAVKEINRGIHIVKLGTMGEYGTPNIDIEEGYINISHKGREDQFLFPRQASSLYHTTKIQDTDLLYFYVRMFGLRVTDLMQGPVYGLDTPEMFNRAEFRTFFNYDAIFGTVFNRFLVQAVAELPLTIYGTGGQVRGYLNLMDTLQCISLAIGSPPRKGEMRILNQFTEKFSVLELAQMVVTAALSIGIDVRTQHLDNPRIEKEEHYYNPKNTAFHRLGLDPYLLTNQRICEMLELILPLKKSIQTHNVVPRVSWK